MMGRKEKKIPYFDNERAHPSTDDGRKYTGTKESYVPN